jgi:uncharacterized alpha-E superfamily protein
MLSVVYLPAKVMKILIIDNLFPRKITFRIPFLAYIKGNG